VTFTWIFFGQNPFSKKRKVISMRSFFSEISSTLTIALGLGQRWRSLISSINLRTIINPRFLIANHDISYYEAWFDLQGRYGKIRDQKFWCSGFSNSRAKKIAKYLKRSVIEDTKPLVFVNGWVLSHAGIGEHLMPFANSEEESLAKLILNAEDRWRDFRLNYDSAYFAAGEARGGKEKKGGFIWQDWDYEFEDCLKWPQLVGHTYHKKPQQKGSSWCIDCGQSNYAMIDPSGEMKIKHIENANSRIEY